MHMTSFVAGLLLSLVVTAVPAAGGSLSDGPLQITVSGQVIDPDGKPVAGASVALREWSSMRHSEDVFVEVRDVLAEQASDFEGKFSFQAVAAPPLKFLGSLEAPWDVVVLADGYGLSWSHLSQANSTQPIAVHLRAAKSVSGRIVDATGQPISDCKVEVTGIAQPGSSWNSPRNDPAQIGLGSSQVAPSAKTDGMVDSRS